MDSVEPLLIDTWYTFLKLKYYETAIFGTPNDVTPKVF